MHECSACGLGVAGGRPEREIYPVSVSLDCISESITQRSSHPPHCCGVARTSGAATTSCRRMHNVCVMSASSGKETLAGPPETHTQTLTQCMFDACMRPDCVSHVLATVAPQVSGSALRCTASSEDTPALHRRLLPCESPQAVYFPPPAVVKHSILLCRSQEGVGTVEGIDWETGFQD
eukprot:GHVU01223794.1.p1 GENE.GHVU01223794.1~~GHVU01223794.1.p1  ORF type:complete len:178 (+),score=0.01 GHVU01223794.1:277-810(+)